MCGYCCGGTPVEKRGNGHSGCSEECYNAPTRRSAPAPPMTVPTVAMVERAMEVYRSSGSMTMVTEVMRAALTAALTEDGAE